MFVSIANEYNRYEAALHYREEQKRFIDMQALQKASTWSTLREVKTPDFGRHVTWVDEVMSPIHDSEIVMPEEPPQEKRNIPSPTVHVQFCKCCENCPDLRIISSMEDEEVNLASFLDEAIVDK
jgi:hypothetical protein